MPGLPGPGLVLTLGLYSREYVQWDSPKPVCRIVHNLIPSREGRGLETL